MTIKPWTFPSVAVAGWMDRRQQQVIEYLRTENRIPQEKLDHRRLILNEAQNRRPETAKMNLGSRLLNSQVWPSDHPSPPLTGP